MLSTSVLEYESYREYLQALARSRGKRGGYKTELAEAMGSHPTYVSRVLSGKANLSLEQADKIAAHIRLDDDEKKYFLFLVEEERAGTVTLRRFFHGERKKIQEKRQEIKKSNPHSG